MLTRDEHEAIKMTVELWNQLNKIVGNGDSRDGDMREFSLHIHAIQRMILAQSAAREYPTLYRLLGETI